jgi:hypothetical protein
MEIPGTITREELVVLNDKYREVKHDINNTIAVLMAMAEMSRLKAEYKEKLADTVCTRSPQIVEKMQEFQKLMNEKLKATEAAAKSVTAA